MAGLVSVSPRPISPELDFSNGDGSANGSASPATAEGLPYELEIQSWQDKETVHEGGVGSIETSIVGLTDGSCYVFRKVVPEKQLWQISADVDVPLATRVNGFTTYIAYKFAEGGIHSRIVGANQGHGYDLLHDAQATLHILNEDDRRQEESGEVTSAPGESLKFGYSMGEMKLLIELGLAKKMGRDIKASIGLDPCLALAVDYAQEFSRPEDLVRLAGYLGREALEVPRIAISNLVSERSPWRSTKRMLHFAGTVGFSTAFLSNAYDKWNVLASGETGRHLPEIPQDAVMVIHFFDKSYFNDNEAYQEALAGYPYFRFTHEDGYHMSGADPRVVSRIVNRAGLALMLLGDGTPPDELADALDAPILSD